MPFHSNAIAAATAVSKFAIQATHRAPSPGKKAGMGMLYDSWLNQILIGSREASAAIGALEHHLPDGHLLAAYRHFSDLASFTQNSLEACMQYQRPFNANKPFGMVWRDDEPQFKDHVKAVHRAQVAELLVLYVVKLEFTMMLAHVHDAGGGSLMTQEATDEYKAIMKELLGYLTDVTTFIGKKEDLEGDNISKTLLNYDISPVSMINKLAVEDDKAGGAAKANKLWKELLWDKWIEAHNDYIATKKSFQSSNDGKTKDEFDAAYDKLQSVNETRSIVAAHHIRQRCLQTVLYALGGYVSDSVDESVYNAIMAYTNDSYFQLAALRDSAQQSTVGFRPEFSGVDEKELLCSKFEKQKEFTSLFFKGESSISGQFVMSQGKKNISVQNRHVVHEWYRKLSYDNGDMVNWALIHTEAQLMADILFVAGPIIVSNSIHAENGNVPVKGIHSMITRGVSRLDFLQVGADGGKVAEIEKGTPTYFTGTKTIDLLTECFEAATKKAMPPGTVGHTTQPMTADFREWFEEVNTAMGTLSEEFHYNHSLPIYNCRLSCSLKAVPQGNPENQVENLSSRNITWHRPMPVTVWSYVKTLDPKLALEMHSIAAAWTVSSQFVKHFTLAMAELKSAIENPPVDYVFGQDHGNAVEFVIANNEIDAAEGLGKHTGKIAAAVANAITINDGTYRIAYPTMIRTVERSKAIMTDLEKAYINKKPPSTFPGHWLSVVTEQDAARYNWKQIKDQDDTEGGNVIINFRDLSKVKPPKLDGSDLTLSDSLRKFYYC